MSAYRTQAPHEPEHECLFTAATIRCEGYAFSFCACGKMSDGVMDPWWRRLLMPFVRRRIT